MRLLATLVVILAAAATETARGQIPLPLPSPFPSPGQLAEGAANYGTAAELPDVSQASHASSNSSEVDRSKAKKNIDHLIRAANHLEAAGLGEEAERIRKRVRQQQRSLHRDRLQNKLAELNRLQAEVDHLRRLAGSESQVQLHVKILEVSPDKFNELGIGKSAPASRQNGMSPGNRIEQVSATNAKTREVPVTGFIKRDGSLAGKIEAMRRNKQLKVLAEPTLVTTAGRPATYLAGGEFPIVVPGPNGDETVTVEWREFGTRLDVVATLLGGRRVELELVPEISIRDFSNAVVVDGVTMPGLTTRRMNSRVQMESGQTLVLGGMISARDGKTEIATVILVRCDLLDADHNNAGPHDVPAPRKLPALDRPASATRLDLPPAPAPRR